MIGLLVAFGTQGRGDSITVSFSGLAADSGQSFPILELSAGPFDVFLYDATVIGPGMPGYDGDIGISMPSSGGVTIVIPPEGGAYPFFDFDSISAVSAPYTSEVLGYEGFTYPDGPYWLWEDTIAGVTTESFTPSPSPSPVNLLEFNALNSAPSGPVNGTMLISITLNYEFSGASVPEPSSIAMLPIGIGFVLACLARRKKKRPGTRGLAGR